MYWWVAWEKKEQQKEREKIIMTNTGDTFGYINLEFDI